MSWQIFDLVRSERHMELDDTFKSEETQLPFDFLAGKSQTLDPSQSV